MVRVMSEVKRYAIRGAGKWEAYEVKAGAWVRWHDFDAQRLRADTAEAESAASHQREARLQEMVNDLSDELHMTAEERDHAKRNSSAFEERMGDLQVANGKLQDKLAAAEQRITKIENLLRQAKGYGGLTPKWHDAVDAALNPNPEAESHE